MLKYLVILLPLLASDVALAHGSATTSVNGYALGNLESKLFVAVLFIIFFVSFVFITGRRNI